MDVFLLDGTYELFRHHFGVPSHKTAQGVEVAATRGVLGSVLGMLEGGVTHLGVATDHVIESFRNQMWPGYKSSAGVAQELLAQFPVIEKALQAMGVFIWPMVELEADDALASGAAVAAENPDVERVVICTPDKDLGQCVSKTRIVQMDRRKNVVIDEDGVKAKFGVAPESIPDYLALVGDSADGFPGLPGFGAKSASQVLARWMHLEDIPAKGVDWDANVRGAPALAVTLQRDMELALLFRDIATLRIDHSLLDDVDQLRWTGPTDAFDEVSHLIDAPRLAERAKALASNSK
jgi:5'-3' exonuclease